MDRHYNIQPVLINILVTHKSPTLQPIETCHHILLLPPFPQLARVRLCKPITKTLRWGAE